MRTWYQELFPNSFFIIIQINYYTNDCDVIELATFFVQLATGTCHDFQHSIIPVTEVYMLLANCCEISNVPQLSDRAELREFPFRHILF